MELRLKKLVYELSSTQVLKLHRDLPTITLRGAFGYSLLQVLARDEQDSTLRQRADIYKNCVSPEDLAIADFAYLEFNNSYVFEAIK